MRRGVGAAVLAILWLGAATAALAATVDVTAAGTQFSPRQVTIQLGDTVRWRYAPPEDEYHTVTSSSSSKERFNSDPNGTCGSSHYAECLGPDRDQQKQTFSHRFTSAGTFTYYCKVHGSDAAYPNCGMCGQVAVRQPTPAPTQPPAAATATARTQPTAAPATAVPAAATTAPATPTPEVTPTPSPPDGSPVALGEDRDEGLGTPAIVLIALAIAGLLGTAAYLVFVRGRAVPPV